MIDAYYKPTIEPHPMHMHGHKFFVVAMERHVDNITGTGRHDRPKISKTQILQRLAKVDSPGFVNAAGKLRQM